MQSKIIYYFINSAAALLVAFATALFLGNMAGIKLTQPRDMIFLIPTDAYFWVLGWGAMVVAFACIVLRQSRFKLLMVLWFAANIIIYRLGLYLLGVHDLRGYIGPLAQTFNLSSGMVNGLLKFIFLFLFTGSAILFGWDSLAGTEDLVKTSCGHCGRHIAFPSQHAGQNALCPNCQKSITLRKPGFVKMSCFFCQEHIEFPTHAIGEKMPCPHCKMKITLKEPI